MTYLGLLNYNLNQAYDVHFVSVPSVQRVVYSTCSINQMENEDVVQSVLPQALSLGFQLIAPFPQWECRGLPLFEGCE